MRGKFKLLDNKGFLTTFSDLPSWSVFHSKKCRIPDSELYS